MRDQRTAKKIGIFGHVGNKNLGDEAIITAVIQNTKCRCLKTEVYSFTINPEDAGNRCRGVKGAVHFARSRKRDDREKIAQQTPIFRPALEAQYDRVFGLLEDG